MNVNPFNFRVILVIGFCIAIRFPILASPSSDITVEEKRERVLMRSIGHEVLNCLGDESSRVLPVEKYNEHYKLSFEFDFSFDPDDIISIVDHVRWDNAVLNPLLVEVIQCESGEVVHSFEIRNGLNRDIIACQGRVLPKDCYNLLVTFIESSKHGQVVLIAEDDPVIPFKAALFVVPVLMLIGFAGYSAWKKERKESDPHKLFVGSLEFDQKNMILSSGDRKVELSHKEGMLLSVLFASANETVEREEILQKVWGDEGDYIGRTLDVFISRLRKKLNLDSNLKVVNIRGVGYKLVV